MKLQVFHIQRVAPSVLRKPTPEVGHRVDELIRDVKEQLRPAPASTIRDRHKRLRGDVRLRPRARS